MLSTSCVGRRNADCRDSTSHGGVASHGKSKYQLQVQNRLHNNPHHFPTYSPSPASPSFFSNSASASVHSLVPGNPSSDDNRSSLNCSDASRGSNVGRWSIEITDNGGTSLLQIGSTRAKQPSSYSPKPINRYSRLRECRVGVVDRDWVKRVGRIAAHVDHY